MWIIKNLLALPSAVGSSIGVCPALVSRSRGRGWGLVQPGDAPAGSEEPFRTGQHDDQGAGQIAGYPGHPLGSLSPTPHIPWRCPAVESQVVRARPARRVVHHQLPLLGGDRPVWCVASDGALGVDVPDRSPSMLSQHPAPAPHPDQVAQADDHKRWAKKQGHHGHNGDDIVQRGRHRVPKVIHRRCDHLAEQHNAGDQKQPGSESVTTQEDPGGVIVEGSATGRRPVSYVHRIIPRQGRFADCSPPPIARPLHGLGQNEEPVSPMCPSILRPAERDLLTRLLTGALNDRGLRPTVRAGRPHPSRVTWTLMDAAGRSSAAYGSEGWDLRVAPPATGREQNGRHDGTSPRTMRSWPGRRMCRAWSAGYESSCRSRCRTHRCNRLPPSLFGSPTTASSRWGGGPPRRWWSRARA